MIEHASLYVWQLMVNLVLYRCTLHDSCNESGYLKDYLLPKTYLFLPFSKGQREGENKSVKPINEVEERAWSQRNQNI